MKAMHTHKSVIVYPPAGPEYACVFLQASYIVKIFYAYLPEFLGCIPLNRRSGSPGAAYFEYALRNFLS